MKLTNYTLTATEEYIKISYFTKSIKWWSNITSLIFFIRLQWKLTRGKTIIEDMKINLVGKYIKSSQVSSKDINKLGPAKGFCKISSILIIFTLTTRWVVMVWPCTSRTYSLQPHLHINPTYWVSENPKG